MRLFLDSSALAKRYVAEPGSDLLLARSQQAAEVLISVLCAPELISGFNRLRREGRLSTSQYGKLKRELAADAREATVVEMTQAVVSRTVFCLEKTPLRASDAIHVASAIESMCELCLTAARRQHKAALAVGLPAEWIG